MGLRTLTVIHDCEKMVQRFDPSFRVKSIPLDDEAVYRMFSRGDTDGVFQFESSGMRQMLTQMKPRRIEDLMAATSIYRPGPASSIPTFIHNREHPEDTRYLHPKLQPILEDTGGCLLYQEQVMQVCRELAGYSYGRADLVRKAMGKKKVEIMAAERKIFIYGKDDSDGTAAVPGAIRNGVPENIANKIFDEMASFAEYAFNKAHAAAYSLVSYQTAYLKCHYPQQYMAALLTSVIDFTRKLSEYIGSCKAMGISILPPDINQSFGRFTAEGDGIRFGLTAIKGLGGPVIRRLEDERAENGPFTSFYNLCTRMQGRDFTRRTVEGLIFSGTLDTFGYSRKALFAAADRIMEAGSFSGKTRASGQLNLFSAIEMEEPEPNIERIPEYPAADRLRLEYEALGLYLSGHPLQPYQDLARRYQCAKAGRILGGAEAGIRERQPVRILGRVLAHRTISTKKGRPMAFATIEDTTASIETVIFPDLLETVSPMLHTGRVLLIEGTVSIEEEKDPKILATRILDADTLPKTGKTVNIRVRSAEDPLIPEILRTLARFPGTDDARLYFADRKKVVLPKGIGGVDANGRLLSELRRIAGIENVNVK